MKTRQDEPLRYVELARQGARMARSLAGDDLPRWSQLVDGDWLVQATVEFSLDADGQSWVHGEYESRGGLLCTRCAEVVDYSFAGKLAVCIVAEDDRAQELAADSDVLVAHGDTVRLVDILEDELLLSVPEELCDSSECERMLPLAYPADGVAQIVAADQADEADQPGERPNPFAVLARLKGQRR